MLITKVKKKAQEITLRPKIFSFSTSNLNIEAFVR